MPLKWQSLSNIAVCKVIFLLFSRWVLLSTGKSMKTLLYADHLFFFSNNVPQEVLTWQWDAILLTAWPKYCNYCTSVKSEGRERQREALKKKQYSVMWSRVDTFGKSGKLAAVAADQRIFQMNQALDRQSHYPVELWHSSGYNLYANILQLFSPRPLWVSVNVSEGQLEHFPQGRVC